MYKPIKWSKEDIRALKEIGVQDDMLEGQDDIIYLDEDGKEIESPEQNYLADD